MTTEIRIIRQIHPETDKPFFLHKVEIEHSDKRYSERSTMLEGSWSTLQDVTMAKVAEGMKESGYRDIHAETVTEEVIRKAWERKFRAF